MPDTPSAQPSGLHRHFGLLQATALNVTQIVGAGIFATIPLMRKELPGPYLLLGWVLGAVLMLLDSLVWSELGAAMPGSGGSYVYLLESYGRSKFGRAMAFLFIWQFLISGPLELGSGLIAMSGFAGSLTKDVAEFNERHSVKYTVDLNQLVPKHLQEEDAVTFGPSRLDKCHMALMERPHSRNQADTLFGSSPRADPSSQIGNGPRNVQIVHLRPIAEPDIKPARQY